MSDRKTASLSSQLNVAKEKLAKVDPHNQPIATVSAFVHIIVRGPIQTRKFHVANDMGTYSLHLGRHEQIESNLWIVRLVSDSFSEFSTTNETHIRMEFRMSSFSPHWNIKSMTTREIDQLDVLEITALFLPENSEVLGGSAVVTFNSIIQKDYPFPPQKLEIPRLLGIAPTEKLTIQNAAAQYHP